MMGWENSTSAMSWMRLIFSWFLNSNGHGLDNKELAKCMGVRCAWIAPGSIFSGSLRHNWGYKGSIAKLEKIEINFQGKLKT